MIALNLTPMHAKTLGERLRASREARGMTQDQLASRSGVSRSLISQWETGTVHDISAVRLKAAARALRCSLDWLLEGETDEEHPSIGEPFASYLNIPEELLRAWGDLTESQRRAFAQQIDETAAHNRALVAELVRR